MKVPAQMGTSVKMCRAKERKVSEAEEEVERRAELASSEHTERQGA